ncbi:RND transporter [Pseudoduganella sp. DS3]|uniref:RND transporter n=1 Tax=Pseudoduganella guangdongensis TaxID=2692179 RepID=A0A6N9HI03_9BURK|nr:copper-binding protein [Pseudoduganella guangdongensis]MYN03238.1 RND transporter [Pseudoduganella guangdongensis]
MKAFFATLLAAACLSGAPAMAQHSGHDAHGDHGQPAASSATDTTDGEIRKVDKPSGKLTIKHGELKNLGMGAMTMVFKVKDAAMLDKVQAGDKVRFTVDKTMTVTAIEAAK